MPCPNGIFNPCNLNALEDSVLKESKVFWIHLQVIVDKAKYYS